MLVNIRKWTKKKRTLVFLAGLLLLLGFLNLIFERLSAMWSRDLVARSNMQKNDLISNEKEAFRSCNDKGYFDTSSYPIVDAQSVFCGSVSREKGRHSMSLKGIVALTHTKPCSHIFKDCSLYLRHSAGYTILFENILIQDETSLIEVGKVSVKHLSGRVNKLSRRKYRSSIGHFFFLPSALAGSERVLFLLRSLSNICTSQKVYLEDEYLVNLSDVILNGDRIHLNLCLFMEIVGGVVRQAYVVAPMYNRQTYTVHICEVESVTIDIK